MAGRENIGETLVPLEDYLGAGSGGVKIEFGGSSESVVPERQFTMTDGAPSATRRIDDGTGSPTHGPASDTPGTLPQTSHQGLVVSSEAGSGSPDITVATLATLNNIANTVAGVHKTGVKVSAQQPQEPTILEAVPEANRRAVVSRETGRGSAPSSHSVVPTQAGADLEPHSTGRTTLVVPFEPDGAEVYTTPKRLGKRSAGKAVGVALAITSVLGLGGYLLANSDGKDASAIATIGQQPASPDENTGGTTNPEPSPTDILGQDAETTQQVFPILELRPATMIPVSTIDVELDADTGWNFSGAEGDYKRTADGSTRLVYTAKIIASIDVPGSAENPGILVTDVAGSDVKNVTINLGNCNLVLTVDPSSYEDELWGIKEPVELLNEVINGIASPAVLDYLVTNGFIEAGDTPDDMLTRFQDLKNDAIYLANAAIVEKLLESEDYRNQLFAQVKSVLRARYDLNNPLYRVTFVDPPAADPAQVPQQVIDYLAETNPSSALVDMPADGNSWQVTIGAYQGEDTAGQEEDTTVSEPTASPTN